MKDEISTALSNLIKDTCLEKLELDMKSPNIFSILRLENHEIRHSNFLAWLLDPNGSHNLNNIFLKRFLKDIFSDDKVSWMDEFRVDSLDMRNIKIYREWKNVDILIEADNFVICIENKVWSSEHSNQLAKYRDTIQKNFSSKNQGYVFLSPDAKEPENDDDRALYVIYSYVEIIKNIETVLEVYDQSISDKVKMYLQDYLKILRRDIILANSILW